MLPPERLPLFPLNAVLFPLGVMQLRVFEVRYLDMVAKCMKANTSFGVCLIVEGEEVGAPAVPHKFGTEAQIVDWDMSEPGLLGLTIRGARRFRILEQVDAADGLATGIVSWLEEAPVTPVGAPHQVLLPLLHAILSDAGSVRFPPPHRLDDAAWVGYRYADILPIPNLARQRLLELDDADLRLSIIHEYLQAHGLLSRAPE